MGDALTSIVDGTKSVSDAFKSMARAIIKELYEVLIVQQLVGSAKAGSRSGIAGGIMNFFGSANGNAMYGGNVIPFASGGVVGSPTTFPMSAGRTGLMGEAGPEAIMPLKRGANGKLGVQSEGGSGDVVIHQNFNFAANGDESVKKLIAQAAPQIANMTKSSIISDRRRGGQMKATFG
jgi:lambda family phage tail tape measure protein